VIPGIGLQSNHLDEDQAAYIIVLTGAKEEISPSSMSEIFTQRLGVLT